MNLFSRHNQEPAIYLEYDGNIVKRSTNIPLIEDIGIRYLDGDEDFRSAECIELLKQADIVVTNPPFSLFREYVSLLVEHNKKFLIIGNQNAITYKEIFKLIKENKLWLGVSPRGFDFKQPDGSLSNVNATWFTNLDHNKRHEDLILYKKYTPEEYPHYDNYDAINVDKTADIPCDWAGAMGVPITFLDKFNPEQFEVIGADFEVKDGLHNSIIIKEWKGKIDRGYIKGERLYARLLIKNKKPIK